MINSTGGSLPVGCVAPPRRRLRRRSTVLQSWFQGSLINCRQRDLARSGVVVFHRVEQGDMQVEHAWRRGEMFKVWRNWAPTMAKNTGTLAEGSCARRRPCVCGPRSALI